MTDRGNYEEKAARFELSRSRFAKKDNKMSSRYYKKQFFKEYKINYFVNK